MEQRIRYKGKCKQCGKEVGAYYKSQVPTFCSYECSNQWKWDNIRQRKKLKEYTCAHCGKKFFVDEKDQRIKEGQTVFYCCRACANKEKWHKEEKICPICGKAHNKSKTTTCCRKCGYELTKYNSYKKKHNLPELTYLEYVNKRQEKERLERERKENSIKVVCSNGNIRYYEQESFICAGREKEYMKEYHAKNKEKRREQHKKRMQDDEVYKFKVKVRKFISQSFKRRKESKMMHTEEVLGCSFEEFMKHLCSLFREGMTIDNYGEWQIDHIIPLSTAKTKEDIITLCHYTNLQPLWAKENNEKRDKLNYIIHDPI